jgi:RimJ/RimL family protein N-acetyltransferase
MLLPHPLFGIKRFAEDTMQCAPSGAERSKVHTFKVLTPTFKPLCRDDLAMLHEWLQRPHVKKWWNEPSSLAQFQHDYLLPGLDESSTRAYIAILEGSPIGFIQSYVVKTSADGWWENETDPGARGIDQFLANADQLGQGIGSSLIRAFIEQLFKDPSVTTVQTDPSPGNERAIRCYRRAGFVAVGTVDTPDGPALLMRIDRPSHE